MYKVHIGILWNYLLAEKKKQLSLIAKTDFKSSALNHWAMLPPQELKNITNSLVATRWHIYHQLWVSAYMGRDK